MYLGTGILTVPVLYGTATGWYFRVYLGTGILTVPVLYVAGTLDFI